MAARPARTLALILAAAGVLLAAGCGGGGGKVSSSTPVDQLLQRTFSGDKQVKSGVLDLTVRVDSQSGSSPLNGPLSLRLTGPFESQGKGKLPKFALTADVEAGGQSLNAGITSTVDKGYVSFQGTNYVVSDKVWRQFRNGYEQSQSQTKQSQGQSLSALGIDPRRWLTNPRNAGETKVGDADVVRITGGVDVSKLLDDVNTLIEKGKAIGGSATKNVPQKLTPQEKQQALQAIRNPSVEIDTGKDDATLRRAIVNFGLAVPKTASTPAQTAKVSLDLKLTQLNQGQDISAPSNPKPFTQLLQSLNGLAGLAAGGSSGGGAASGDTLKRYSQCVNAAGGDSAKARKCADLLTP